MTTETGRRKREGKFGDRVRLHVLIMSAQDQELSRLTDKMGMSRTDAVIEALQMWMNSLRERGV